MSPATVGRLPEDDKQRDRGERRDHQQLVVVDIGNDLRLLRDHGVERGAAGGGQRVPELRDAIGSSNIRLTAVTCCAISA